MLDIKNELEILLEKVVIEFVYCLVFFSVLLEVIVWVLGRVVDGEQIVEDSVLDLQYWEKDDGILVILFFILLEVLQQVVVDEQVFVMMLVCMLMVMMLGELLFFNLKLLSGKEFILWEISYLLGEEGSLLSIQMVLEGGEVLLLFEVVELLVQMVDLLIMLFKMLKIVKWVFLCLIKECVDVLVNLLIGIEVEGDIEVIIQIIGSVVIDILSGDEFIDICQVVEGEKGISYFMIVYIMLFYEKCWGSFLCDFKQNCII